MNNIKVVNGIPLTIAGMGAFDGFNRENEVDFLINQQDNNYTVEVFDANILDNKAALLKKLKAKTLDEAVNLGYNYQKR